MNPTVRHRFPILAIVGLGGLSALTITGCATTQIQSRRNPTHTGRISRLLVVSDVVGSNVIPGQKGFDSSVASTATSRFGAHGVITRVETVDPLALKDPDYVAIAQEFRADALLRITPVSRSKSQSDGGEQELVTFDLLLLPVDREVHEALWRAQVTVVRINWLFNWDMRWDEDEADKLVTAMIESLVADQLIAP